MKRRWFPACLLGIIVAAGWIAGASTSAWQHAGQTLPVAPTESISQAFSLFESAPTRKQLDSVLGAEAFESVLQAASETEDIGLRTRAIYSLRFYRDMAGESIPVLETQISQLGLGTKPSEFSMLRAAMAAYAELAGPAAGPLLESMLDHPMRDIRLSVVRGLQSADAIDSISALRERQKIEDVSEVQVALMDAIRTLVSVATP